MAISLDKLPDRFYKAAQTFSFAGVVALTRTAVDCQKATRKSLEENFTLRNKHTQRGIRIEPATKKTNTAKVFSVDEYIADHEEGETRDLPDGNQFVIPAQIREVFKISEKRKIPKSKGRTKIVGRKIGKSKPYLGKSRKGKPGIFYRDKDKKTRLLYAIHTKPIQLDRREWFFPTVEKTYNEKFPLQYKRALNEGFKKLTKS